MYELSRPGGMASATAQDGLVPASILSQPEARSTVQAVPGWEAHRSLHFRSPAPGSADWMRWFQSRPGTEPQDPGSTPTDYDMVFAFKTLPMWWKAMGPPGQPMPFSTSMLRHGTPEPKAFNEYNGAPLKPQGK